VVAVFLAASATGAAAYTIGFDGLSAGARANDDAVAQSHGVSFASAFLTADLDADGNEILDADGKLVPGFTHFAAYDDSDIRVGRPADAGYGTFTSLAIDARFDQVLVRFDHPTQLARFSFSADGSDFGNLQAQQLLFLDAAGKTVQTSTPPFYQPGLLSFGYGLAPSVQVSSVLLTAGKFYDNVTITAVPEAQTWLMMMVGLAAVGCLARCRA